MAGMTGQQNMFIHLQHLIPSLHLSGVRVALHSIFFYLDYGYVSHNFNYTIFVLERIFNEPPCA
jgi:hypothetical protein